MAEEIKKVGLIDKIPGKSVNKDDLVYHIDKEVGRLLVDSKNWYEKYKVYLSSYDDFITSSRKGKFSEVPNIQIPIIFEKKKALHSRIYKSLFAVRPWYQLIPLEKLDKDRVDKVDKIMHWALVNYINKNKGIKSTIDSWISTIIDAGHGILKLRWDNIIRKVLKVVMKNPEELDLTEEEASQLLEGEVESIAKEEESIETIFEGPMLEVVRPYEILFPDTFTDPTDLDEPHIVVHMLHMSEHDLNIRAKSGLFDKKAVNEVIGGSTDNYLWFESLATGIRQREDRYAGVKTVGAHSKEDVYTVYETYMRYDIDGDGLAEEIIVWYAPHQKQILRWTYLDRVTQMGTRPFVKCDLIPRDGRGRGIGLPEMLYNIQTEVNIIHNQRVEAGQLTNKPWGLVRAGSGLKAEEIEVESGILIPVDDVNDIRLMDSPNLTNWGFQEESLLNQYADRISGITDLHMGLVPDKVGGTRTATGTAQMLNEGNMQIDILIERIQRSYGRLLKLIHGMLAEKLPEGIEYRVIGSDGRQSVDQSGAPIVERLTSRDEIAGKYDFELIANSQSTNRELEKQNGMLLGQVLLNPILLQTGIVGPDNIYNIIKNLLEKYQVLSVDSFITKPQFVDKPLTVGEEIAAINQGIKPRVVLNDQHEQKIQLLQRFMQEPIFQQRLQEGMVPEVAPQLYEETIQDHQRFLEIIQAQAQTGNVTGLQISPSLGARVAGQVDQKTGRPVAQPGQQPQQPEQPNLRRGE